MTKSKYLSSAILAALLATAASAQAAPEFYGNIDMGVGIHKVNGKTTDSVDNGNSSASIYGVRGSEDLGSGLKAIFQLEGSFKGDDGTQGLANTPFNRDTFVGLTDGTNTFKLGRLKTLNRAIVLEYDAFNASAWGIAVSTMDQNGNFAANTAQYDYAGHGVKASFQHSAGEVADGGIQTGSTDAASVRYANGPLSVTVAHTRVDGAAPVSATGSNTMVGAGYDFGVVKTTVMYQNSNANKASNIDSRFVVSAIAPVASNVNILAQAGQVKLANGDKASLAAIGGQYILSKRTNLYASLNRNQIPGQDGRQLTAGIRHQF
jgi:predicted porin